MKIGIDASFLRKPGTGIGQVTEGFLRTLTARSFQGGPGKSWQFLAGLQEAEYILYTEERVSMELPERFHIRAFLPKWWRRDDAIRKMLWEKQVAREAMHDGCTVFVSLYQSATVFSEHEKVEHVMVVHDIIPRLFPQYARKFSQRIHWQLIERGIRCVNRIVAISESTKNDLVENLHVSGEKIFVAYLGLTSVFESVCTEEQVRRVLEKYHVKRGYIYHGGGLEIRKNTEGVLRAYKQLIGNSKQSTKIPKLLISGKIHSKANPLATDVRKIIEELHLQEWVVLLGFVPIEDLPALYRGAILFVYPSLYEGFGLPPVEAMSQGTPVVTSDVASLPEVCGDAALLINPNDPNVLAAVMQRLLKDVELCENLRAKGLVRAKTFTWDAFMKGVLQ